MCGIAGIIGGEPSRLETALIRLERSMAHRGPDSSGRLRAEPPDQALGLAHTRLAIIDLSPAGTQPMVDADTGNAIVFNGEIYNFMDLRREIEGLGRAGAFFSHSDTEVLLRGYALWGTDLFERLDGMFALLLYDRQNRRLVVARDHVGIKPLYWAQTDGGGLVFASEVRAIKESGLWQGGVDHASLADYLAYGSVKEPRTILTGVTAFPPAHYALVDLTAAKPAMSAPVCYWDIERVCAQGVITGPAESAHAKALSATVAQQLVADVPIGVFLSAGIDSTALAEAIPIEARPRLHAFTVARRTKDASEAELAARTAGNLGIRHTVCDLSDEVILDFARDGLAAMDQPSHDGLNVYVVSRVSKQAGIIAALCGAGADELHGGYGHFGPLARLAGLGRLPGALPGLRAVIPPLARWRAGRAMADRARLLLATAPDVEAMVAEKRRFFTPAQVKALWPVAPPGHGRTGRPGPPSSLPALTRVSLAEISGYLKDTLLRDADWAAMANHQELRVPYLGKAYMELALRLPWSAKIRRGKVNKPLLAAAISPVNRHVIDRPKTGFELDYGSMLRTALRDDFHQSAEALNVGLGFALDPQRLLQDLEGAGTDKLARRVWALYALGSYLGRHGL